MQGWNPWNKPLLTWKALLPPTAANKGGAAPMEYTITAECSGCTANATQVLSGVVFGDMWYCSGQSNMWLPMDHSLSRNETVAGIKAGNFSNVRGMFGGSGNVPDGGKSYHVGGEGYGRKAGSSPWMTASQAIATGSSASTGGSYPLFKMGAACWYFGQRLSELGVDVPIGLADTAIGGQRIEEFMNNATISKCTNRSSENIRWWDGQLFATQVLPFVDMTVKGWGKMVILSPFVVLPVSLTLKVSLFQCGIRARTTWARLRAAASPTSAIAASSANSSAAGARFGPRHQALPTRWLHSAS